MSRSRHPEPVVRSYSVTHPAGRVRLPTQPGWDHIVHAEHGTLRCHANDRMWVVTPGRALLVADGTQLELATRNGARVRVLYLAASLRAFPPTVRSVTLTELARQLIRRAIAAAPMRPDDGAHDALVTLLIEVLGELATAPLELGWPTNAVAVELARRIEADPAGRLTDALRGLGASRRTLERRFSTETGTTLAGWRRRCRILAAAELLAAGRTITAAALEIGYATPSSFVAGFRAELGTTPGAFRGVP